MSLKSSFIFTLSEEIDYSDTTDGTLKKTKKIKLLGPLKEEECELYYVSLKSMISKAALKIGLLAQSSMDNTDNEAINQGRELAKDKKQDVAEVARSIISFLEATGLMLDYIKTFKKYLLSGVALIDGKLKILELFYNKISIQDKYRLMEEYIANFFSEDKSAIKEK